MNQLKYIALLFFLFIASCYQGSRNNTTVTISEDTEALGKFLDFSVYKPTSVTYKYTFINNESDRLSVPGPSDYFLEALLEFDVDTFKKIKSILQNEFEIQNNKDFYFDWLPKLLLKDLKNKQSNFKIYKDDVFNSGIHGKIGLLDNKILLRTYSN